MFAYAATAIDELGLEPGPRTLELSELELARAAGLTWRELVPFGLVPPIAGRGDDDDDDGDDDDAKGKSGRGDDDDDDDDAKGKSGRGDDDDDDDDDDAGGSKEERLERALIKSNRENRRLAREARERQDREERAAGKHKDRADRLERELEELRGKVDEGDKKTLLEAAAEKAGFRRPVNAFKLAKADGLLEDVEDEATARRIVRDLAKDDPDLLKAGTRQGRRRRDEDDDDDRGKSRSRRDRDDDDEDDEDDDDRGKGRENTKTKAIGPARLRQHFREDEKRGGKRKARGR